MPRIVLIISLLFSSGLFAQTYHFNQTYQYFEKTIAFGTVHGYLPITTDTTDSVAMRWVARTDTTTPAEWVFNFDDQNNFYPTVSHLDSGDFYLKPPGSLDQKMIIGLAHNLAPSQSSIFFTIFPLHDPSDSTIIEFDFNIIYVQLPTDTTDTSDQDTTGGTGFAANVKSHEITAFWKTDLVVQSGTPFDEVVVYNLNGQMIYRRLTQTTNSRITLKQATPMVIVSIRRDEDWSRLMVPKLSP